ncbi:MAG TPA: adenylate/guanylate cyclase domain-containing protein [Balneolaceae bacterium]|nr:adenylate/guanylate cyclase domain-containing protein [Balneolaceae bacterium]
MGSKNNRLLAAVMFTDIVGYTALMQEDEREANKQRERHRSILEKRATEFEGKTLHFYGDGAVTIFNSAYKAVMCAIKIQKDLKEPFLPLRIGIHMGDIAYNDQEVFGDAVNIAARLETLSVAGGILLSEKIKDEINNQPLVETISLGSFELKNVKHPIHIFAVSNSGISVPSAVDIKSKTGMISNRIAVLPFINMSDELGFDYFSDGLTEEIINGLTKLGMDVTSRTSAFAFKGHNEDIRQIGEKLSVSKVLEGSVRKSEDRIRVTAQLIETGGGFHLWSETYDGHLKDIFEIQDTISEKILNKFEHKSAEEKVAKSREDGQKAYDTYLEGKFLWNKWTISSVNKALRCFQNAIEMDPGLIYAYTDAAFCYVFLGFMGQMSSPLAFKRSKELLEKAVRIDDSFADTYVALGSIQTFLNMDLKEANKAFAKAFMLDGNSAHLFHQYSQFLNVVGKNHEAIQWLERALEKDPKNTIYNSELGRAYYFARRYTEALEQYNYTLQLDSSYLPAVDGKGWVYAAMEEYKTAHKVFEIFQNLVVQEQKNIPQLVYVAARMEMEDAATHFLEVLQLGDIDDSYKATAIDFALINMALKKYDETFFYLKRAVEDQIGRVMFIQSDPVWDDIRYDMRFKQLLDQIGLLDFRMESVKF